MSFICLNSPKSTSAFISEPVIVEFRIVLAYYYGRRMFKSKLKNYNSVLSLSIMVSIEGIVADDGRIRE
jgi:hypothetical protein